MLRAVLAAPFLLAAVCFTPVTEVDGASAGGSPGAPAFSATGSLVGGGGGYEGAETATLDELFR